MGRNLIVMEVKPVNADKRSIRKDLKNLVGFIRDAGYKRAVYLVFGEEKRSFIAFKKKTRECADSEGISLAEIELWWHCKAEREAIPTPWCDS
jgi:hypothetical protein